MNFLKSTFVFSVYQYIISKNFKILINVNDSLITGRRSGSGRTSSMKGAIEDFAKQALVAGILKPEEIASIGY